MFGKKEKPEKKQGFIKRLRARLNRGDSWLTYDLANLAPGGKIDEDTLEELESLLVMADVGVEATEEIIGGLQKNSFIDFPGRISCVLFLSGCNYHCPYCHNPELARGVPAAEPPFTPDQFYAFLEARRSLLEGVVISGGDDVDPATYDEENTDSRKVIATRAQYPQPRPSQIGPSSMQRGAKSTSAARPAEPMA